MIRHKVLMRNGSWCRLFSINKLLNSPKPCPIEGALLYSTSDKAESNELEETLLTDNSVSVENEETDLLEIKRNKSGLNKHHYSAYHKKCPFTEDEREVMPLTAYRKLYGRFGSSSNVEKKALWPSIYELEMIKEKERVQYPHTVHEMIKMAKEAKLEEERAISERQMEIREKMKNLGKWIENVNMKVKKREEEARKAMELKQKQIDEVREVLGYQISPYDPKFTEVLEKKLEEDRIKLKKEKKLRKQQMMLDKLTEMAEQEAMAAEKTAPNEDDLYGKKIE